MVVVHELRPSFIYLGILILFPPVPSGARNDEIIEKILSDIDVLLQKRVDSSEESTFFGSMASNWCKLFRDTNNNSRREII